MGHKLGNGGGDNLGVNPLRIIPWRRRNAGTINRLAMHPGTGVRLAHTLDGVHLNIGPETLRLEGQYQVSINLTSEDVLRLFLKTFPELALGFRDIYTAPEAEAAE
jgi:hypothetical protein